MSFKDDAANRAKAIKTRVDKMEEKKKNFLKVFAENHCLLETTCYLTGVAMRTAYSWTEKDPEFKEQFNFLQTVRKQRHIITLHNALDSGVKYENSSLLMFYLKTQCGWSEEKNEQVENINLTVSYKE